MSKATVRAAARARRASTVAQWSPSHRAALNAALADNCLQLLSLTGAQRICAYIPVGDEPGNQAWVETLAAHTTALYLPRSEAHGQLTWGRYTTWGELEEGRYRIPQPRACTPQLLTTPPGVDLIFLPASSVGRDGTRLGKGAGYYDRTLAAITTATTSGILTTTTVLAAITYSWELVQTLPTEPHDMRVGWAITPAELYKCALPRA